jgi:hypothetical protein
VLEDTDLRSSDTYPRSSKTTSHKSSTKHLERALSLRSGILLAKKNTTDCDLFHTPRPTCFSSASPLTAQTHSKMFWIRYVFIKTSSDPSDFTDSSQWYPEVLHFCPTTPIILCGLKSDLRNKRTCIELLKTQGLTPVTQQQGKSVATKMGAKYMECSSKEMNGVHEIFDTAIDITVRGQDVVEHPSSSSGPGSSKTGSTAMPARKKKSKMCSIL